jgi:hypothetical protein
MTQGKLRFINSKPKVWIYQSRAKDLSCKKRKGKEQSDNYTRTIGLDMDSILRDDSRMHPRITRR